MRELWEADLRATAAQRAIPVPQLYIREGAFSIGGDPTRVTPTRKQRWAI